MALALQRFYHSEKLQSTKTQEAIKTPWVEFYHSEKLQSTKTVLPLHYTTMWFYHSEKLQSTKTPRCPILSSLVVLS